MIVRVEFDDVGTAGNLIPYGSYGFVDARDLLGALRYGNPGLKSFWAVGTAGDNCLGSDQEAGSGYDALVDGLLKARVGKSRAFGAEVALRGETGHQRPFGLDNRPRRAQ